MLEHTQMSERRACRLVGLSRDAWRHPPQPDAHTMRLGERIHAVAMERRRFGYRRVHDMLRTEFPELKIQLRVPDEKTKRHGQAVAAASLPALS